VVAVAVTARDEVLGRIAAALRDVPAEERPEDVEVPRDYRRSEPGGAVDRFVERLADYGTEVRRVAAADVAETVGEICGGMRLAVPAGLPAAWLPAGLDVVPEETLDVAALDAVGGALTGCALAIAETGTIVLDGGTGQGSRRLTLVPDFHLCVVAEGQIVGGVPEAMGSVAAVLRADGRPVTFVSGPSATSDIEFARVEGVHGPRRLVVLVVAAATLREDEARNL
jgi:L-lactate dehydrogenase complex protein LldG